MRKGASDRQEKSKSAPALGEGALAKSAVMRCGAYLLPLKIKLLVLPLSSASTVTCWVSRVSTPSASIPRLAPQAASLPKCRVTVKTLPPAGGWELPARLQPALLLPVRVPSGAMVVVAVSTPALVVMLPVVKAGEVGEGHVLA